MFFQIDESLKKKCPNCNYILIPPYPKNCPNCDTLLNFGPNSIIQSPQTANDAEDEKEARLAFTKSLMKIARPDVVISESNVQKAKDVKEMGVSNSNVAEIDSRVKVKVKTKTKIDFACDLIDLGIAKEYVKFIGVTSDNRTTIFSSNEKYHYLLDLSINLSYIASSILKGELDRMILSPMNGDAEEVCYFFCQKELIYVIYGNIPDKKAAWLLNQIKIAIKELLCNENPDQMEKVRLHNIGLQFQKQVIYFLEKYIELQDVFTSKKLVSLDEYLRIDYFGFSYQSAGIVSKLLTEELDFSDIPNPIQNTSNTDENDEDMNFREMIITAKVEAIAANTVANTAAMPKYIAVKLGFQHYRYLIFDKMRDYYVSLLAEGNLDYLPPELDKIHTFLDDVTKKPFMGDLADYHFISKQIKDVFFNNKIE
jgi:hypothetical protein